MIKSLISKYKIFIKYIISAGISYAIDLAAFTIFCFAFKSNGAYILIATVLARIISSFANFMINKNKVFNTAKEDSKNNFNILLNYYLLVIVQMLVSGLTVAFMYKLIKFNLTITKFLVDLVILVVNYLVQKQFIFNI